MRITTPLLAAAIFSLTPTILEPFSFSTSAYAATPIEIPGKGKTKVLKKPSVKATPIEIPGKGKVIVRKKPSVEATPIEIPGKGKPVIKLKPLPRPVQ